MRRNGRSEIYKSYVTSYRSAIYCSPNSFISFNGGLQFTESTDLINSPNPKVTITACNGVWTCPPGCNTPGLAKQFFTGSNQNSIIAGDFEVFQVIF